jgi:hypothetical protein
MGENKTTGTGFSSGFLSDSVLPNGLQTFLERLSQHDHAWAAAKGAIVHTAVSAIGVITELPKFQFDGARFKGTTVDACA